MGAGAGGVGTGVEALVFGEDGRGGDFSAGLCVDVEGVVGLDDVGGVEEEFGGGVEGEGGGVGGDGADGAGGEGDVGFAEERDGAGLRGGPELFVGGVYIDGCGKCGGVEGGEGPVGGELSGVAGFGDGGPGAGLLAVGGVGEGLPGGVGLEGEGGIVGLGGGEEECECGRVELDSACG